MPEPSYVERYYTCDFCDHATFRLTEAIEHFAQFGYHHSFSFNGELPVIRRNEWKEYLHV
jgi:hypothetical protein